MKQAEFNIYAFALGLGIRISVPLLLLTLLGVWLDDRYDTSPWYLLAGITLSLILTTLAITSQALKAFKELNKEEKTTSTKKKSPTTPPKND